MDDDTIKIKPIVEEENTPVEEATASTSNNKKKKNDVPRKKESAVDLLGKLEVKVAVQKAIIVLIAAVALLLLLACVYLGSQAKTIPYVIELTPDGNATYYEDAVKLLDNWEPNDATQRYFMVNYVTKLRTVSSDNYQNKENVQDIYSKTLNSAVSYINNFYETNNPITLSANSITKIPSDEISIVRYSDTQWKVTWRETTQRKNGQILSDRQYEGLFTTAFYTPATDRDRRNNPIGMYITSIDIDQLKNLM